MASSIGSVGSGSEMAAIQQMRTQAAERMLKAADANKDGKITESELSDVFEANGRKSGPSAAVILKQLDQGNKGYITQQDLEAGIAAVDQNRQSQAAFKGGRAGGPPPGGGGGGGSPPTDGSSSTSTVTSFELEDLNLNGIVTNQEKLDYALKVYNQQQDAAIASPTFVLA